jgi:hypothetical protein
MRTSRRDLLTGIAAGALSLGATLPARAQSTLTLDRFMRNSTRLCGVQLSSRTFGADILALLSHEFSAAQMSRFATFVEASDDVDVDFRVAGLQRIVSRLVAIWYSGVAPMRSSGERILSYTDAAAWAATGYAKPPSYCGAAFGEWAQTPNLPTPGK